MVYPFFGFWFLDGDDYTMCDVSDARLYILFLAKRMFYYAQM